MISRWLRRAPGLERQDPAYRRWSYLRRAGLALQDPPLRRRAIGGVFAVAIVFLVWLRVGPLPSRLLDVADNQSTTVFDRNGEILYESRAGDGTRAMWLDADALPANLISATIAAEDRRFYTHAGVDPVAIARASWRNIREGAIVEGGSTISQQVAKLLLARQNAGRQARGLSGQDSRSDRRGSSGASSQQARDPHALSESCTVWQSDPRRRESEPRVLRIASRRADAGPGGLHRRTAAAAVAVQSAS